MRTKMRRSRRRGSGAWSGVAAAWAACIAAAPAAALATGLTISDVEVTAIEPTAATIRWRTNVAATTEVEYGATPEYGEVTLEDPALVTLHRHVLRDLAPGTTYHFRVHSRDLEGNEGFSGDHSFHTPDPRSLPVRGAAPKRK